MKHLDLYSGIGGFALACEWVGVETICFVEIDKFCRKVLNKHWPNVPIIEDVNNVEAIKAITELRRRIHGRTGKQPAERGVEAQRNTGTGINPPLLLTAGFPCQPFSNAGRKRGASDDRYLWPQTLAVIEAVRPTYVLLENVAGILNMVFPDSTASVASQASLFNDQDDEIADYNTICGGIESDLRQAGYETVWLVIPACGVGAPHRRDRVWVVALSGKPGLQVRPGYQNGRGTIRQEGQTTSEGHSIPRWTEDWYEVAARVCRMDARVSNRVDRLKSLGNAIVPAVALEIIKVLEI